MRAIEDLNLTVKDFGRHHRNIVQLAFEDKDTRKDLSSLKKADNIHKFAETSDLFDFFYDEKAGTSVVRCIPCFELHCQSKAHVRCMPPLKAQQKLNPGGKGTFWHWSVLLKRCHKSLDKGG